MNKESEARSSKMTSAVKPTQSMGTMVSTMGVTLSAPGELALCEQKSLFRGRMLLRVLGCGVCGTDKHIVAGLRGHHYPLVLGHEFYGEVVELRAASEWDINRERIKQGDYVAVVPGKECGRCASCRGGKNEPQHCANRSIYGVNLTTSSGGVPLGGMSEYVEIVDGYSLLKVPHHWGWGVGALLEPLAVSNRAVRKLVRHSFGREFGTVLVLGAGIIGIGICLAIRRYLGSEVRLIVADPIELRRKFAEDLGATSHNPRGVDWADNLKLAGGSIDCVFEASGDPKSFSEAVSLVARGGFVVELGNFVNCGVVSVAPSDFCSKDLTVLGSVTGGEKDFIDAKVTVEENLGYVERLVGKTFCLGDAKEAIKNSICGQNGIRTMVGADGFRKAGPE